MKLWVIFFFILMPGMSQSFSQGLNCQPKITPPQMIGRPPPIVALDCKRPFTLHGETFSIDSPESQDAENLKQNLISVPKAYELIEQYQLNRKKNRLGAYSGTTGLLVFLFSSTLARMISPRHPTDFKTALQWIGGSIALGGWAYSFSVLYTNEALISQAVQEYNQQKPNDQIEILFSNTWSF